MLVERHADTGILRRHDGNLVLALPRGGRLLIQAWPAAERYLDQEVHLVGRLVEGNIVVAESISPVRPS